MHMLASTASLRPKKFSNFCALTAAGALSPMSFDRPCIQAGALLQHHAGTTIHLRRRPITHLDAHDGVSCACMRFTLACVRSVLRLQALHVGCTSHANLICPLSHRAEMSAS